MQKSGFRLALGIILLAIFFAWQYFSKSSSMDLGSQGTGSSFSPFPNSSVPTPEYPKTPKKVSEIPLPKFKENPKSLFVGVENGHSPQEIQELVGIPLLRAREVQVQKNILDKIPLGKETSLHLSLFEDAEITAQVKKKKSLYTDSIFISGPIKGMKYSHVNLTQQDSILVGKINVGNRGYQLVRSARKTFYIIEVDPTQLPAIDPKETPNPPARGSGAAGSPTAQMDSSNQIQTLVSDPTAPGAAPADRTVKVLVLYTATAAQKALSEAAIRAEIANEANLANAAFEQSGVNAGIQLVAVLQTNYVDATDMTWDLDRLAHSGDGFLDEAQTLKKQYDADLVHLFTAFSTNYCGIHFLGSTFEYSNPRQGYGVTARQCNYKMTFAHEIGHGLGADHDPANAKHSPVSYARGYIDIEAKFRTIMAYHNICGAFENLCPVIGYFSTPLVTMNGRALGNANADNARRINEVVPFVARNASIPSLEPGYVLNAIPGENFRLSISMPPGYANATRIDWYQDSGSGWQLIPGAYNYYYDAVTPASGTRYYHARIFGPGYEVRTSEAYIGNIRPRPNFNFSQFPQPYTVSTVGGTATFSVSVTSPKEAVNYQWSLNGNPIGTNSSVLTIPNVTANGYVGLVVSNTTGNLVAPPVALKVVSRPNFTLNLPATAMRPIRPQPAQLVVKAEGSDNIIYQWYKDGVAIAGANTETHSFIIADEKSAGTYWAVAKNQLGETQSAQMKLSVYGPPKILTQPPAEKLLIPGTTIDFSATAEGFEMSYQWLKDGIAVPTTNLSGRNNRYVIGTASTADAGHYRLVVTNPAGSVSSNEVNLGTPSPPSIVTNPAGLLVTWGESAVLAVTTRGYPGPYYRWTHVLNGVTTTLPTTTRELVIPKTDWAHQGQYFVEVYNDMGSVKSTASTLSIRPVTRGGSVKLSKDGSLLILNRTGGFLPIENRGDARPEHP